MSTCRSSCHKSFRRLQPGFRDEEMPGGGGVDAVPHPVGGLAARDRVVEDLLQGYEHSRVVRRDPPHGALQLREYGGSRLLPG